MKQPLNNNSSSEKTGMKILANLFLITLFFLYAEGQV